MFELDLAFVSNIFVLIAHTFIIKVAIFPITTTHKSAPLIITKL